MCLRIRLLSCAYSECLVERDCQALGAKSSEIVASKDITKSLQHDKSGLLRPPVAERKDVSRSVRSKEDDQPSTAAPASATAESRHPLYTDPTVGNCWK